MGELEERINSVLGDPGQMEKITRLARSLMGGETQTLPETPEQAASGPELFGQGMDAELMGRIGRLLSGGGEKGRSQALLEAMKPYLSDSRREKMDKALQIARLARLAGLALGDMEGEK